MVKNNQIYNESYNNTIKRMKRQEIKVDAIITDPPYNISRENNFTSLGRSGIDFGQWDKGFNQKKWIRTAAPIVKEGGSIIIFNDWRNMGIIADALERNGFIVKDILRWKKKNPMPRNVNRRYVTDFELAIWAVKGDKEKWTFNNHKEGYYLRPEFIYSAYVASKKRIHPTQKSIKLIQDIIKIHTNVGDTIYDPFSGSGSISFAAKKENRNYIGSEINQDYYLASIERLQKNED